MDENAFDILKPALISGGALGFLAGLPGLDLFNCCTCCSLGIGAGFLAAYLYSRVCARSGVLFDAARGAGVGALAGFFWGLTSAVVSTLFTAAFGDIAAGWLLPILESNPSVPPEMLDQIEQALEEGVTPLTIAIDAVITLGLGVVFATIGGLIGSAVFKPKSATPIEPM